MGEEVTTVEIIILVALGLYGVWRFHHVLMRFLERLSR